MINSTGIYGWALDEGNLNEPVTVEIYVDGSKLAYGKANEDRPDLVPHFGNNSAARYHGFHLEWNFNGKETKTYTISAKICGKNTILRTEQVTFEYYGLYRVDPAGNGDGGILLPEVVVKAPYLGAGGGGWTGVGAGINSGGSYGNTSGTDGGSGNDHGGTPHGNNSGTNSTFKDIDDSELKPCMKAILDALKNNKNIPDMIKVFSGSKKDYNWKLKDGSLGANQNAATGQYNRTDRIVTTTFDTEKYVDASPQICLLQEP